METFPSNKMLNTVYDFAYKGLEKKVKDAVDENPSLVTVPDGNKRLLLHWAALSGNTNLVRFLLDAGSPVDAADDLSVCYHTQPFAVDLTTINVEKDSIGMTAMILASSANRVDVVLLLLERGADVNRRSDEGHSAIQYAASKGWKQILQILIENGADVNVPDRRGATPLHRAASKGNVDIVETLLAAEAKPDVTDSYLNTPLHLACEESNVPVAAALIRAGANTELQNRDKKTPIDLATHETVRSVRSMLEEKHN